jgi:mannan polymerase II complex ANP1 subunit
MEQERLAREEEEKEKAEMAKKVKENFGDTTSQWEKDRAAMHDLALKDERKKAELESDTADAVPGQAGAVKKPTIKDDTMMGSQEGVAM